MKPVVTFGELMLRLSPPQQERLLQSAQLDCFFGGSEANVAVSLSRFGIPSRFVTALPLSQLGDAALSELKRHGLDTSGVVRNTGRLGLYFYERGAAQRSGKVIYDRKDSAFALSETSDYQWPRLLQDASWLHLSGISPALSDGTAASCIRACQEATSRRLPVSLDLNYRKTLWSVKEARLAISNLTPYVDVLIANEEDLSCLFDYSISGNDLNTGMIDQAAYGDLAKRVSKDLGIASVAITLRSSHCATHNTWSSMIYHQNQAYLAPSFDVSMVDRVGAGDAFAAGLIYALLQEWPSQKALEFANAAGCLKHSISGDFNLVSYDEVQQLAQGKTSGRIQR